MVITYEEYMKRKKKKQKEESKDGVISLEKYAEINGMDLSTIRRGSGTDKAVETTITVPGKDEEEKKDEKWYDGWFQESKGNLLETVVGSGADLVENAGAGILGMGESILDGLMTMQPYFTHGQNIQNGGNFDIHEFNKSKEDASAFIQKDLYDEKTLANQLVGQNLKKTTGIDTETMSVFGEKSDALAQSAGQLVGQIGLNAVGVPWFVTSGLSAGGSEAENALNQGATLKEAFGSGLVSAGAEILTEKISGGIKFGGKTLDDAWVKPLTENISNSALRTMAKMGFDAAGEGAEEVVSQVFSNLGSALYREEDLGTILTSQEALDGYIESFIGGAVLGGGVSGIGAGVDAAKGVDHATGLTKNEKAVVDAIAEERFAEAEKNGEKLTVWKKSQIRSEIESQMDKGYIEIDKIESILGGDDYKAYRDSSEKESRLQKEIEAMKDAPNTIGNVEARDEMKRQLKELQDSKATQTSKDTLYSKVMELTKNDRLAESYNEKGRRGKAFEADLTKYDAKQQATIQKAVDSGILNNTNRTHEFVDMIAKISADKGVSFDFTNNQKLKESGFALEGKTVNGYIQDGNISLNINAAKALNKVVGHEITHVLEGTELYTELQDSIIEYAKSKGDYDTRWENIVKLYRKQFEGQENEARMEQYKAELTADLVGDYIFSDPDFVNNLSVEKPNIFKKIYDEIKYMVKVATAGSKEAKQLLEVQRAFDKAYKESARKESDSTKYSIEKDANGKLFVNVTEDILDNDSGESAARIIQKVIQKRFDNLITVNGQDIQINKTTNDEFRRSNSANALMENPTQAYDDKLRTIANADEILKTAKKWIGEKTKHIRKDDIVEFARGNVDYKVGENGYTADVIVGIRKNGAAVLYDLVNIYDKKIVEAPVTMASNEGSQRRQDISTTDNVSQDKKVVKKFSLSEDSQGRKLSNEQMEFYKDSKIRDDNGNLKVMYHGSPASFTQFDKKKAKSNGYYGSGFYFSESESHASQYGSRYEVYLNIKKPMQDGTKTITKEQLRKFVYAVAENEDYGIENYGYGSTVDSVTDSIFGKDDFAMLMDINATCVGDMVEAIQLFNEVNGTDYDGIIVPTETVAFYPEQIKSVDNANPTSNPDINLSLSANTEASSSRNDVYGSDIALDIPTRSDIAPVQDVMDDIPTRTDIPVIGDYEDIPIRADVQQADESKYEPKQTDYPSKKVTTVAERNEAQREALKTQLQEKQRLAEEVHNTYNREIASLQQEIERVEQLRIDSHASFNKKMSQLRSEYDATPNKDTKSANALLQQIENTRVKRNEVETQYENQIYDLQGKIAEKKRHRADSDANSEKAINDLKARIDKMNTKEFKRAEKRMTKQEEYRQLMSDLIGDTSTWVDKTMGIFYKVNTLRRNLRDIVRDENGNRDIAKADAIHDEIQGKYNHHEAQLNREANEIKKQFRDMKITKEEDAYIQMLGEYRHNPHTEILAEDMTEFYNKHKDKIDTEKVDKIIDMAREMYDDLFVRLNKVLREQGMQEIQYHKGYFPHFTEEKQGPLAKLLGWKTKNDDIPTDIAGLTENFNPDRSWQSFNKHRTGDSTDYSFMKGLDNYVQGSLDWIYHIEDIQKRRALENEIRYRHSDKAIQEKIEEINQNEEYSAEEAQEQIDMVLKEARNPLNNFVSTFRTQTNTLAGKKSSMDREMEQDTNRRFYSTMTNLSNRVNANLVGGSISSARTQFIPVVRSWAEVSPTSSLQAMKEAIASYYKDDGIIDKSDFLTNRLRKNEALYKSWWDKAGDKIGWLMEACDDLASQTVWRSKYMENIANGMSETEAIKNADQFAENLMAGRSRGNAPAIFDSKNPAIKMVTAFQLEVVNDHMYMLKDLPQEMQNETKGKLVAAYGKMFIGSYVYNALTGSDAAFEPISIIEGVLRDMGLFDEDEEKEPGQIVGNLVEDIIKDVPFVGGLMGGGRIPISSALPYDGISVESIQNLITDISEGDMENIWEEMLNPVFYLASPAGGGGQLKKTLQGMKMFGVFGDDLPIAGSYTPSGKLRFSVEDNLLTRLQAAVFGQYASENARDYFDNGRSPLTEKQTRELVMLDIPIRRYWDYRQGLKKIEADKDEDGNSIPGSKKQKIIEYIDSLDVDLEEKMILFKFQYPSDDTYNYQILEYLNNRTDISDAEKKVILKDLDFTIDDDGTVRW